MPYFVNCQHYFYSGQYMVEIAYPGIDYAGSDMLATDYPGEREYDDPREALDAAIKVREALQADHPDEEIGIAFGHFDMVEGEPQDLEELRIEIEKHYESLPKCDRCGGIIEEPWTVVDDPDFGQFCSKFCIEETYSQEPMGKGFKMQPFELSDISTEALIETKRKYTNALYNKELEWKQCDICRDVHELYEDEIDSYTEENEDECEFCPLYKPEWCKCYPEESKLALPYHEEQAQLNKTNADTDLAWERALTEYLRWISIELVRRRTETIAAD